MKSHFEFEEEDYQKIAEYVSDLLIRKIPSISNQSQKLEQHLTRTEAAKLLHITLPTLNKYTREGKIQGYRLGSRVLYKRSELEKALTEIPSLRKGLKR